MASAPPGGPRGRRKQAKPQRKVPNSVQNISLSLDYTLSWTESVNCDDTDYIIYVHSNFGLDHIYQTKNSSLDVSFLPHCEQYRFVIIAHSANSVSAEDYIDALIPAPPEADLTIEWFNVTETSGGVLLEWAVTEPFAHCAHYFRVIIVDYQVRDVYVENTVLLLNDLVPCMDYEFTVRAIYNLALEGPIVVAYHETPASAPSLPTLENVIVGDTYANVTWALPAYSANPCPITSIVVDGLPYYASTHLINDAPTRPHPTLNLSPLNSDSMYYFRVYVVNSAGRSEPFRMAVQTLA